MESLLAIGILENFKEGWASFPFRGDKVHCWKEVDTSVLPRIHQGERVRLYEASCGFTAASYKGVKPLVEGNFPRCKKCSKAKNSQ